MVSTGGGAGAAGRTVVLVFGIALGWFNTSGWFFTEDRVLPALTLGAYYSAYTSRIARTSMIEILSQDFIRTARAKGATEWRVVLKHALKGALQPLVTLTAPITANMVTGSFVVEKIFDIPGLGRFFVAGAFNRDFTLVVGCVLVYATLTLPAYIGLEAALSFLGVGVQAPETTFGAMLANSVAYFRVVPTYLFIPGIVLVVLVVAFNLFGDAVRDALDPKAIH